MLDTVKKLDYPINILKNKNLSTNYLEDIKKAKNPHITPPVLVPENMPSSQPPSRQMQLKGLSMPADPKKKEPYEFIEPIHKQINLKEGVQYIKEKKTYKSLNREVSQSTNLASVYSSKYTRQTSQLMSRRVNSIDRIITSV